MKAFVDYMAKIKAEDELKAKTKTFVRAALDKRTQAATSFEAIDTRRKRSMKKVLITAAAFAACAALAIGGYVFYNTPVSFVGLDINPSVELGVNVFNIVVSVKSYNDDGASIIAGSRLTYMRIEKAINTLVQNAAKRSYIEEDGSTVIAVTTEKEKTRKSEALQVASEKSINAALQNCRVRAVIFANCADPELRKEAKSLGISPGKYKMIKTLQALDPSVTVDEFKDAKIKDIVTKAGELIVDSTEGDGKTGKELKKAVKEAVKEMQEVEKQIRKNEMEAKKTAKNDGGGKANKNGGKNNNGNGSGNSGGASANAKNNGTANVNAKDNYGCASERPAFGNTNNGTGNSVNGKGC